MRQQPTPSEAPRNRLDARTRAGIVSLVKQQGARATPAFYPLAALCPDTGGTKTVQLLAELAGKILRYGPRQRYYEIAGDRYDKTTGSPVQQVLLSPAGVFKGIREHQQGGMCYSGVPTCAYTNDGNKVPPIPGKVFCVYVNPRDHLFEWGWEQADPDEQGLPLGYQERFEERIWPKQ